MISLKKDKGSLSKVEVSSSVNSLTLKTLDAPSLELALNLAKGEGFCSVASLKVGELTLSKGANEELLVNKVLTDFKKLLRGVEVTTPYHEYSEVVEPLKPTPDPVEVVKEDGETEKEHLEEVKPVVKKKSTKKL